MTVSPTANLHPYFAAVSIALFWHCCIASPTPCPGLPPLRNLLISLMGPGVVQEEHGLG